MEATLMVCLCDLKSIVNLPLIAYRIVTNHFIDDTKEKQCSTCKFNMRYENRHSYLRFMQNYV